MAISQFKAKCLAVLERVRKTGKPIQITRFGEPVADVVPPEPPPAAQGWIGSMASTGHIVGDIVGPVSERSDWEVFVE